MQAKFVGRWVPSGNSMTTGYAGSSLTFIVNNTRTVTITTTNAVRVAYKIDNNSYVSKSGDNVTISNLSLSSHKIKVVLLPNVANWGASNYAVISDITVDNGGTIYAPAPNRHKMLVFGDSITEGWSIFGDDYSSPELTWWNIISDNLSLDSTPVGVGGIGYIVGAHDYPAVSANPSFIEKINVNTVVSNTDFDFILLELGTNDGKPVDTVDADYVNVVKGVVNRIIAKYPSADIHALIPFSGSGKASLLQAYAETGVNVIPQDWYSKISYSDGIHPDYYGSKIIANNVQSYLVGYYTAAYFLEGIMDRIDIVYFDENGDINKATGVFSSNPTPPAIPQNAIKICEVRISQGATNGTLTDKRQYLSTYSALKCVNVRDYGAKGDGTTDDTLAIQRCIDENKGKIIIIPYGTYVISNTVYTYRGDYNRSLIYSQNATIKASNDFPTTEFMINIEAESTGNYDSYWDSRSMSGFIGGIIDGNNRAYGALLYTGGSIGKLMDFSTRNTVNVGVQLGLPGEQYWAWSQDIYMDRVKFDGISTDDSVGLLIYSCDNNIAHVRTSKFPIGIKVEGGGNVLTECHPLYFVPEKTTEVAFDIIGEDTRIINGYSDGYKTCIRVRDSRLYVEGFNALFASKTGVCTFVDNSAETFCGFVVQNATIFFNNVASSNVGCTKYCRTVRQYGNYGFFATVFKNLTSATDVAIASPLAHDSLRDITDSNNLDLIGATGTYPLDALNPANDTTNNRPDTQAGDTYWGVLEVKTKVGTAGQLYDASVQRLWCSRTNKWYKRGFFGVYGTNEGSWSAWVEE